jgi:hypothetical protein
VALIIGLGGTAALLILGLAAVLLISDDDDPQTPTASTVAASDSSGEGSVGDPSADGGGVGAEGGEGDLTATCAVIDSEMAQIDLTNSSTELSNFSLVIVFYDEAGSRVGDTTGYISSLRPGERTVEPTYLYDELGATCEVADIDRTAIDTAGADLASGATCTVTGEDFIGSTTAEITVTNTGSTAANFSVEASIVDSEGIRRGSGYTTVEAVQPGETAPSDLFIVNEHDPSYTCEVVYIDVYDNG